MIELTKELMEAELAVLAEKAFSLPEVKCIRVRDTVLERDGCLPKAVREAVDKSWHDRMSDVDLCVTVGLHPDAGVKEEHYMRCMERFGLGRDACLGRSFIAGNRMWRLVKQNGMRYDFGFAFEYDETGAAPVLPRLKTDEESPWPAEKADAFWFVQVQALGKLFRRDYLIADHLAHMGLNETLVQQMVLRDMAKGTNHHRYGDGEERGYEMYLEQCPFLTGNESHDRIARKLYAAGRAHDELMMRFDGAWKQKMPQFAEIWQCYAGQENKSREYGVKQ